MEGKREEQEDDEELGLKTPSPGGERALGPQVEGERGGSAPIRGQSQEQQTPHEEKESTRNPERTKGS